MDRAIYLICRQLLPLAFLACTSGCATTCLEQQVMSQELMDMPRELNKATLAEYRVAPPDVLLIEAVNAIRRPDMPLVPGDILTIRIKNGIPLETETDPEISPTQHQLELELELQFKSINGEYQINPDGTVNLGPAYGSIPVGGLTVDQARDAIYKYLTDTIGLKDTGPNKVELSVTLANIGGKQLIAGQHLVRPDGTVSLGIYGQVYVAGMTLPEIKSLLEAHLTEHITDPEVSVDVMAYNSKVFYVITDGGGYGEQVIRLPFTGNETVLDAIAQIQGLSEVSSKKMWIARPAPSGSGCSQILDVHWDAITAEGITATNYQLFPGDRIYIQADPFIKTDNFLAKALAPAERLLGITLLGTSTARTIKFFNQFGSGFGNTGGGVSP